MENAADDRFCWTEESDLPSISVSDELAVALFALPLSELLEQLQALSAPTRTQLLAQGECVAPEAARLARAALRVQASIYPSLEPQETIAQLEAENSVSWQSAFTTLLDEIRCALEQGVTPDDSGKLSSVLADYYAFGRALLQTFPERAAKDIDRRLIEPETIADTEQTVVDPAQYSLWPDFDSRPFSSDY
jgi:hypothetical protein